VRRHRSFKLVGCWVAGVCSVGLARIRLLTGLYGRLCAIAGLPHAEAVRARRRGLAVEDQQDQCAERDDADQHPPARPVEVMQAAHRDGQRRDVVRNDPQRRDEGRAALPVAERRIEDQGDDPAQEHDQRKHPELGASRPSFEIEVAPHGGDVGIHWRLSPVRVEVA